MVAICVPGDCNRQGGDRVTMPSASGPSSPPDPPSSTPAAGTLLGKGSVLGRYLVLETLGTGAMGVVYAAYDPDLDRKIALKLLRPVPGGGDLARRAQRLFREAKATAKLSHPNVVAVHDVGVFEGQVFIAMEFLGGGTLRRWLTAARRPWSQVVSLFLEIGRGLGAAHAAGLIHRDLKPENVLLGSDGRPRVVDFGLVRLATADPEPEPEGQGSEPWDEKDARLTRTGALVGTPAYMAPEQFEGKALDGRTDQFAFCVMLFEALYAERPFKGDTVLSLAASVSDGVIAPISTAAAPAWVRRILLKGLSTAPEERFATMDELLAALADDPALRRRRRLITAAVAVMVAGTVAIAWTAVNRRRRQLDAEIAGRLAEGETALAQAEVLRPRLEQLRQQAFARFDAKERDEGERLWQQALEISGDLETAYERAERHLDAALLLEPSRAPVRERLSRVVFERAAIAERQGRKSDLERHLRRLADLDSSGAQLTAWRRPATLSVRTDPPRASLTLERYRQEPTGLRTPIVERTLLGPAGPLDVPPGSYRLVARAPGHVDVTYPILLRRGERLEVSFSLPAQAEVPAGFVYVPAGRFLFGEADESMRTSFLDTVPIHETSTGAFLIARNETTYGDWIAFLEALPAAERRAREPRISGDRGSFQGAIDLRKDGTGVWRLEIMPARVRLSAALGQALIYPGRSRRREQDWTKIPVSGISPDDATAYTDWLHRTGRVPLARLCTEKEWERAARGADDRIFPHGDRLLSDEANIDATYGRDGRSFGPDAVGSYPASISPFGVHDLAGNVIEFTTSALDRDGLVARGGGYYHEKKNAWNTNRFALESSTRLHTFGFRVCAPSPGGPLESLGRGRAKTSRN
jgi:formylglycine-generating enzyme required for sulfatase activity